MDLSAALATAKALGAGEGGALAEYLIEIEAAAVSASARQAKSQ